MGAHQSTRRISIVNDSQPSAVIKVSEKVVDRLKGNAADQDQDNGDDIPETAGFGNVSKPDIRSFRHVPVPYNIPLQGLPYITSKDIQQELESEIEKNNAYWEKRINDLQETHKIMNQKMETEYIKAAEEIEKLLPKVKKEGGIIPCQKGKSNVMQCYKKYPKQTLNCAAEVENFAACITREQIQDEGKV